LVYPYIYIYIYSILEINLKCKGFSNDKNVSNINELIEFNIHYLANKNLKEFETKYKELSDEYVIKKSISLDDFIKKKKRNRKLSK